MITKKFHIRYFRIILFLLMCFDLNSFAGEEGHGQYFCTKPEELVKDRACVHTGAGLKKRIPTWDCDNIYFKCKEDCTGRACTEGCPHPYATLELFYKDGDRNKDANWFNQMSIQGLFEGKPPFTANSFRFRMGSDEGECSMNDINGKTIRNPDGTIKYPKIKYPKSTNFNVRVLGDSLNKGQQMLLGDALCSENKQFILMLQKSDGHLCVSKALPDDKMQFVWCNGKYNYGQNPNTRLSMEANGSLILYKTNDNSVPIWPIYTQSEQALPDKLVGQYLQLNNEGMLIIAGKNSKGVWGNAWTSNAKGTANDIKFSYCKYSGQN